MEQPQNPERVEIDQIVAYNIRRWRREAGMTQEELGEMLGWSAANLSAAERSADSARERRRFDAQTLAELALALGVPLAALFMPPDDNRERVFPGPRIADRYREPRDGTYTMRDLMHSIVLPDTGEDSPVMETYRIRFREAGKQYLDEEWAGYAATFLRKGLPPEMLADLAEGLMADVNYLERVRNRLGMIAAALGEGEDGQDEP